MDNFENMSHHQLVKYSRFFKEKLKVLRQQLADIEDARIADKIQLEDLEQLNKYKSHNTELRVTVQMCIDFIQQLLNTHPDGMHLTKQWAKAINSRPAFNGKYQSGPMFIDIDDIKGDNSE